MLQFLLAAFAGAAVGVLSGLLGIGGGTVMVPLFRLAFGLEPIMATATSLFTIIPTSVSGLAKHARNKTCIPRVGIVCGVAGACFSPIGVWAATKSPGWLIMAAAATVIFYSSFTMFKKALHAKAGGGVPRAVPHEPKATQCGFRASETCLSMECSHPFFGGASFALKLIGIGAIAGLCGGYVGVGGGFIMVPLFVSWLGIPMRLASGTSLMAVFLLAIPGVVEQALLGNIHYSVGIAMALGAVPGAVLGAGLVKRVPERTLRFLFAGFLVVMACVLLLTEANVLG